eukprot:15434571-Alexandrium_andersonii.AAC.1
MLGWGEQAPGGGLLVKAKRHCSLELLDVPKKRRGPRRALAAHLSHVAVLLSTVGGAGDSLAAVLQTGQ